MENLREIEEDALLSLRELEQYADAAKEKLRFLLRNLRAEDMVAKIKQLYLSDKSLNFLCVGIALENEDYEICAAVEKIKKERATKIMRPPHKKFAL